MSDSSYVRLTGKTRTLTGYSQAWLGSDHLLIVNSSVYVERYQRFILSDIQAIVFSQGRNLLHWRALAVAVSICWGLWAFKAESPFGKVFFALTGLLAFFYALRELMRGPRCQCVLQTAVSRERLRPVSRLRVARKFLAALTPAIEAVQGSTTAAEMERAAALPEAPVYPAAGSQPQTESAASAFHLSGIPAHPPEIPLPRSYLIEVLFGLFLLDSVLVWVGLQSNLAEALGLLPMVFLAEFFLGVIALLRAITKFRVSSALVIVGLICVIVDLIALSGPAGWQAFLSVIQQQSQQQPPRLDVLIQAPARTVLLAAGWRVTAGVLGLGACYIERRKEGQ